MQLFFNFSSTNTIGDFFSQHGAFGVDVFFVISGFIMAFIVSNNESTTFKEFALNRIIRIIPNYWFWTVVFLFLGLFIPNIPSTYATFESLLMSFLFISHDNPSPLLGFYPTLTVGWTLNLEMFFYLLMAIVLLFQTTITKKLLLVLGIIFILPIVYKFFGIEFYKSVFGNIKLFEFGFGIIIFYMYSNYKNFFFSNKMAIIVLLILTIILFIPKNVMINTLVLSGGIIYFALVMENFIRNIKGVFIDKLIFLGDISYSTYLAHPIALWIVFFYIQKLNSSIDLILALSSYLSLTLVFSFISYKIIEIKFSKLLKARF